MQTETFYDTVKLFEQALGVRIILNLSRTAETESISIDTGPLSKIIKPPYKLTVPYEGVGLSSSSQDSYAMLQHGISHVIFGSTSKVVTDFFEEAKHQKLKEITNILEDERIEDCLSKLYIGAYQDLQQLKPRLCNYNACDICKSGTAMPTVADMLFRMRSNQPKLCSTPNERCLATIQARDMVLGGKSIKATFAALKLLEKYVDDEGGKEQSAGQQTPDPNGTPQQTPPMFADFESLIEDNLNIDSKDLTDMNQTTEQLLQDSIQEFLDQLVDVQKSLDQNTTKKEKVFGKVVGDQAHFEEDKKDYKPDPRIKQLRKFFKDLKFKEQQKGLDDGGELLDIDGLISNRIDKNGEVFQSIESTHGLEVTYVADLSGSMKSGGSLQIAKQALVDMVELSKGLFDVKVFGFAGHSSEPTVSLVQQIPLNKIATLDVNSEYCYTHTHHGVQIASQKFSGVSTKRVLIIITDGMPCSAKYDDKIMDAFAKKAISDARKSGIRVYTIISGDCGSDERISNIFGRESTISKISNVEDIHRVMKENTIKNLLKTIRGG